MNEKIVGLIAVIIVIAGGWYVLSGTSVKAPSTTTQTPVTTSTTTTTTTSMSPASVPVIYTDQGFSPKSITVPLGTTVTFVNQSSKSMWVGSDPHPTHQGYDATTRSQHCPDTTNSTFDECAAAAPGNSFSFTFNKEGIWKYHNHVNASQTATIIVTAPKAI